MFENKYNRFYEVVSLILYIVLLESLNLFQVSISEVYPEIIKAFW